MFCRPASCNAASLAPVTRGNSDNGVSQLVVGSGTGASIGGRIPKQINRAQKGAGATCRIELNAAAVGAFFDQSHLVQAAGVLGDGGNVDTAFCCDVFHAHVAAVLQETDDFDAPMIGQTTGELCATTIIICHGLIF